MALIDLKVPAIGESITEVTLSRWLKDNGSQVSMDEAICEFDSDKATLEFPSEASGTLIHVAKEGDDLAIGAIVARIDTSESSEDVAQRKNKETEPIVSKPREKDSAPFVVPFSGKDEHPVADFAVPSEVEKINKGEALKTSSSSAEPTRIQQAAAQTGADLYDSNRSSRREKMSRMRRTISKRLVEARNHTAMLTTFNEVDMTAIIDLRKNNNEAFEKKYGIKIGFMSLFAKACSQVLMEMPEVNAFIDGDDIIYHNYVDIAVAISTPAGLVVPPIRNVESISIHDFEKQLKVLAEKARTATLSLNEMSGGTFTITNGGIFGSLMSTPILNLPQSAILGMHAIKDRPVVVNGEIVIRPMMYLALSYDHRIIDGSSSVRFLVKVKELLEDPIRMILHK